MPSRRDAPIPSGVLPVRNGPRAEVRLPSRTPCFAVSIEELRRTSGSSTQCAHSRPASYRLGWLDPERSRSHDDRSDKDLPSSSLWHPSRGTEDDRVRYIRQRSSHGRCNHAFFARRRSNVRTRQFREAAAKKIIDSPRSCLKRSIRYDGVQILPSPTPRHGSGVQPGKMPFASGAQRGRKGEAQEFASTGSTANW